MKHYKINSDKYLMSKAVFITIRFFIIALFFIAFLVRATGQSNFANDANSRIEFLNKQGFGLTPESIAEEMRFTVDQIENILQGRSMFADDKDIEKFCKILKCNCYYKTGYKGTREVRFIPYERKQIKTDTLFSKKSGRVVFSKS